MRVFIGLGSNLADPIAQVKTALADLEQLTDTQLVSCSSLYRSPPMGPQDQPDYINAVAELTTSLTAHQLLAKVQLIEQQHGRVRKRHWGERTLDLDLLLFGDKTIHDQTLQIPHPGIAERAFVLYPLAEIAPDVVIPGLAVVNELLADCPLDGLQRIENWEE